MSAAKRGDVLLPDFRGRRRGRPSGQERQRDRALDVGEDGLGAGPVAVQQRGQLVGRRDPRLDQVTAGAGHGAQGQGLGRVGDGDAQLVLTQPQVLGDHQGVAGVALGSRDHLAVAPGFDRGRLDRHDRVPGLQQCIDQPPSGR